jgi:hypothetical protein
LKRPARAATMPAVRSRSTSWPSLPLRRRARAGVERAGAADELTVQPPRRDGERVRFSARLATTTGERRTLWFSLPRRHADAATRRADPFVLAALWGAMRSGRPLRVRGAPVSPSLLRNLEEFQRAWVAWRPRRLQAAALLADDESEARRPGPGAVAAFSGGVDSCYTVFRHAVAPDVARPRELRAAVMVHGFDIPRDDPAGFAGALARARRALAGVEVELIPVETNVRTGVDWLDGHGLCLAAALTLFGGGFGAGLISATGTYRQLVLPWGSNPVTDPLLGSQSFEIVHSGAALDYIDKVRALAAWPAALENLRFCWEGEPRGRNCGRCRKCVQVGLILQAAGVASDCFDEPLAPDVIARVLEQIRNEPNPFSHWTMQMILEGAEAQRLDAPWVEWLRRELPAFRVPPGGPS